MITAAAQGFGIGLGLIMPIGAQNAWILKRGVARNHPFISASICAMCDAVLVTIGAFGGGHLLSQNSTLLHTMTVAGVIFLSVYSLQCLRNALRTGRQWHNRKDSPYRLNAICSTTADCIDQSGSLAGVTRHSTHTLRFVIIGTLAVTLLNPHVYIDTVFMLGSIAGQYKDTQRAAFAAGSITASVFWFYTLSLCAVRLAPVLDRPVSRCIIDFLCALFMATVAGHLLFRLM